MLEKQRFLKNEGHAHHRHSASRRWCPRDERCKNINIFLKLYISCERTKGQCNGVSLEVKAQHQLRLSVSLHSLENSVLLLGIQVIDKIKCFSRIYSPNIVQCGTYYIKSFKCYVKSFTVY